jgi:5-formyltetrahydrofolate cyclo-ligase
MSVIAGEHGNTPCAKAKSDLRSAIRAELDCLTSEQRARGAARACARLKRQAIWSEALTLLCYAPLPDELDAIPLIEEALRQEKIVALPQFDPQTGLYRACQITAPSRDLVAGKFGIREPARHCPALPLNQLDLTLIPGVAFDATGRRLGRGRGYYDRLLAEVRGIKCGLGFDEQIKPKIPVEQHDVLLDCVVTPGFWLDFRQHRHGDDLVG